MKIWDFIHWVMTHSLGWTLQLLIRDIFWTLGRTAFLHESILHAVNGNNELFVFKIMFVAWFVLVQLPARSTDVHKGRMSGLMATKER